MEAEGLKESDDIVEMGRGIVNTSEAVEEDVSEVIETNYSDEEVEEA